MELELSAVVFLVFVSFIAGFVDSIAGGGGILTIPALLSVGIPPTLALGTNKLQACFGSFSATFYYFKKGMLTLQPLPILCVFSFSALGTLAVQFIDNSALSKILPFLLIIFAFYFLFSPKITQENRVAKKYTLLLFVLSLIGFYDGFFGPGTGSFFMLALLMIAANGMVTALAHAKLYNFMTNLASLLFFALLGNIIWSIGLLMAVGQFVGANLGSRIATSYGAKIIKPLVVGVSLVASLKLLWEQYF